MGELPCGERGRAFHSALAAPYDRVMPTSGFATFPRKRGKAKVADFAPVAVLGTATPTAAAHFPYIACPRITPGISAM